MGFGRERVTFFDDDVSLQRRPIYLGAWLGRIAWQRARVLRIVLTNSNGRSPALKNRCFVVPTPAHIVVHELMKGSLQFVFFHTISANGAEENICINRDKLLGPTELCPNESMDERHSRKTLTKTQPPNLYSASGRDS